MPMLIHPRPERELQGRYPGKSRGFFALVVFDDETDLHRHTYDLTGYHVADDTLPPRTILPAASIRVVPRGTRNDLAEIRVPDFTPLDGYQTYLRVKLGTETVIAVPLADPAYLVSVTSPAEYDRIPKLWFTASGTGSVPVSSYTKVIDAASNVRAPYAITGTVDDWQVTWDDLNFPPRTEVSMTAGTTQIDQTVYHLFVM